MEISRTTIIDALDNAGYGPDALRENYSGRGMYGTTCMGVVIEPDHAAAFGASLVATMAEAAGGGMPEAVFELVDALRAARTDSMGLDVIVYFPDIDLLDDED